MVRNHLAFTEITTDHMMKRKGMNQTLPDKSPNPLSYHAEAIPPRQPILILTALLVLLIAAQCQPDPPANVLPTPQPPTPTPFLIPPIQPGDGTDVIDRLLEAGVIRVGIRVWPEAEFSPPAFRGFSNAATGGALNGFEIDIAHHIAQNLGLELELIEAYPPIITSGDWQGEWDIALASLVPFDQPLTDAPIQDITYSRPYAYMPMGFLIPTTQDDIQTFAQLANRRVGVLEHSAYERLLTSEEAPLTVQGQPLMPQSQINLQIVALSNLQKAIRQLGQPQSEDSLQIDAIFGPIPILEEAIRNNLPVKLATAEKIIGVQPLAIAAVPQDGLKVERLLSEINSILNRLQQQGTLPEIYIRWYGQDLSRPP